MRERWLSVSAFAALALCGWGTPGLGQQCETKGRLLPSGDYEFLPSPCNDIELYASFSASKGAFSSAQIFNGPSLPPQAVCSALDNTKSCLKYTGDCSPANPHAVKTGAWCPPDPNSQPGEISCWCQKPNQYRLGAFPKAGPAVRIESELRIDKDVDGFPDAYRYSTRAKNGGAEYVRSYKLFEQLYRFDWEDLWPAPDGDYNDYISHVQVRNCSAGLVFPSSVVAAENRSVCADNCNDNPCDLAMLSDNPLRFLAAVGIDQLSGEGNREVAGRTIHLSLASYFGERTTFHDVAVCPVLLLSWRTVRTPAEPNDWRTNVRYGAPACGKSMVADGLPKCLAPSLDTTTLPISFAIEQFAGASCAVTRSGPGDRILLAGAEQCGAFANVQSYQISIDQIDAALASPGLRLNGIGDRALAALVQGVRVFAFENPQAAKLHCPSGVNVLFDSADSDTATVYSTLLTVGDGTLSVYHRR